MSENGKFAMSEVPALHVARALSQTAHNTPGQSLLCRPVLAACRCDHPLPSYWPGSGAVSVGIFATLHFRVSHVNLWRTRTRSQATPRCLSQRAKNKMRPVESRGPRLLKISLSQLNRFRRNKRVWLSSGRGRRGRYLSTFIKVDNVNWEK